MLLLVAIWAIFLAAWHWADDRYCRPRFTKTYYVGDLLRPDGQIGARPTKAKVAELAELLQSSVTPDVWWFKLGSVRPYPLESSLNVRHTVADHWQVETWLSERRKALHRRMMG